MSAFDLELLSEQHDKTRFHCGSESLDRYLRNTARGHLSKGMSVTRVLVERDARPPKPVLGYPPMTGGWAVVGVAAVGFNGHSVRSC